MSYLHEMVEARLGEVVYDSALDRLTEEGWEQGCRELTRAELEARILDELEAEEFGNG